MSRTLPRRLGPSASRCVSSTTGRSNTCVIGFPPPHAHCLPIPDRSPTAQSPPVSRHVQEPSSSVLSTLPVEKLCTTHWIVNDPPSSTQRRALCPIFRLEKR